MTIKNLFKRGFRFSSVGMVILRVVNGMCFLSLPFWIEGRKWPCNTSIKKIYKSLWRTITWYPQYMFLYIYIGVRDELVVVFSIVYLINFLTISLIKKYSKTHLTWRNRNLHKNFPISGFVNIAPMSLKIN